MSINLQLPPQDVLMIVVGAYRYVFVLVGAVLAACGLLAYRWLRCTLLTLAACVALPERGDGVRTSLTGCTENAQRLRTLA